MFFCKGCKWAVSCPCLEKGVIKCMLCPDVSTCRCSVYWKNESSADLAIHSPDDLLASEDLTDDVL